MEQYDYKYLSSAFSSKKVLRQVEEYERDGWTWYFLRPALSFLFGSGGSSGMEAVMRRSHVRDTKATNES